MEEKKSRRNKRVFIVSAVLVLLIAIGCFGGVTFAKYVSGTNVPTQQATAAKWGFVVTVNTENMFHDAYNDDNSKATWAAPGSVGNGVKVSADTKDKNRVAPGTSGSMTITIEGSAEVAAKITFAKEKDTDGVTDKAIKDISLTREASGSGETAVTEVKYNPVVWTIKKDGTALNDEGKNTLDDCLTKLAAEFDGAVMAPGTTLNKVTYTLEWVWAFETGTTPEEKAQNNKYDTILGYAAAGKTGDILEGCTPQTEIEFGFSITIEQSETGTVA